MAHQPERYPLEEGDILGVGEIQDRLPYNSVKLTEFTRRARTLGNETSTLTKFARLP